jgi:hypothetical protein
MTRKERERGKKKIIGFPDLTLKNMFDLLLALIGSS